MLLRNLALLVVVVDGENLLSCCWLDQSCHALGIAMLAHDQFWQHFLVHFGH